MRKIVNRIVLIVIISLFMSPVYAARIYKESYFQSEWAQKWNGVCEYKLSDGTRVDVLTKNYAVEFDFAPKWAESVGQSLHYGRMTGKKPAIVLIIEKPSDWKYYKRVESICEEHNITLWYMISPVYYWNRKINIKFGRLKLV